MSTRLDNLSSNLNEDQIKILSQFFTKEELPLVRKKGVFPCEYLDSFKRLRETQLPPKEAFYSGLNEEHITDEDYAHAKNVWKTFNANTLEDYLKLYNKTDVLLLADVYENLRNVCRKNYDLDPSWYYTAPGLAWDAALKITEVKLELLSETDTVLMVENGLRGGVSMCVTRYSKANNKFMGDQYVTSKLSKYLMYVDANSLYSGAMSEPLPTHDFKWMTENEFKNWEKYCGKKGEGCILEVELEYPKTLHDFHNDFPLAPEHLKLEKVKKIIPNLYDEEKYVLHYRALKTYIDSGLKLKNITRGYKFKESNWLKSYIDLNNGLRTKAENEFEKDFFKLMNNSVFGKTMENVRNRVDIKLLSADQSYFYKKQVAKPNYDHTTIFDKNLVALHMKRTLIKYDKPVYLGMSILDISKTCMYNPYYIYFKKKYNDKVKLCYADTDSFIFEIETYDLYEDIRPDIPKIFDTSNYPTDHPCYYSGNKKVIGKFKDELGGKIMTEFVGLKAKMYAYKTLDNKEDKRCKKSVVKNELHFANYKDCLFTKKDQHRQMRVLRSRGHEMYTEKINKIALSHDNDKSVILKDSINILALGHYKLDENL